MGMVSMKNDLKDEEDCATSEAECCDELYPYGLQISLCDEDMVKLGITADSLTVGQKLKITANVDVIRIGMHKEQDGTESEASLQITDLDLGLGGATQLQALYNKSRMNP